MMSKPNWLGLLALLLLSSLAAAQDVQPLAPNTRIERELTSTQVHTYRIALKAGQFVHFDVFQKSIDVVLTLTAPDGKQIAEVDLPGFGLPESLSEIATSSGEYQLTIRSFEAFKRKGQYQLKAEVKDAATNADKKRMTAERLGWEYIKLPDLQKRLENAQQSRALWAELGERFWEGYELSRVSFTYKDLGDNEKAFATMEQALAIMREIKSRAAEAVILADLGGFCAKEQQWERAIRFIEQSNAISVEVGNPTRKILNLRSLGDGLWARQQTARAEAAFTQMLEASRAANDRHYQVEAYHRLGNFAGSQGQYAKSMAYLESGLAIARDLKDINLEATSLIILTIHAFESDKIEKALEYANSSLAIVKESGNLSREAELYEFTFAQIYRLLGRRDKELEALEKSLSLYREAKNKIGEAFALLFLGSLYSREGINPKVLECLEQSEKILKELNLTKTLDYVYILHGFADYHIETNNPAKAFAYLEQALALCQQFNQQGRVANTLRLMGTAYRKLKQYDKAIDHDERALRLWKGVPPIKTRMEQDLAAMITASLMYDWREAGNPELAIYYGKLAINHYQDARSTVRQSSDQSDIRQALQQTFDKSIEKHYRELADLLISQARLPEAEQVLRMLKEEEYFEYIRGDANSPKGEKATLTPKEEAADKRYREVADKLAALGAERAALLNKPSRTAEEDKRLAQIESDLAVAGDAFQKFLNKLNDELKTTKDAGKVSQLREAQGLMEDLRELGNGAVALYTVVGEDKYSVVLTTADVQKAYQVPIKAAELNRKVLAFRAALQNPTLDPLPLAQELYKILLAPVADDLRAAKAQLLMWSLDGVLRYVPMAALHDSDKYLVESYRHAVFTPASNARLHFAPSKNWRALGLGVTKAHGENIPALPGVAEEMRGIIKTDANGSGVLPGTVKLDEQFTEESMLTSLRESNNVIHIASHFKFQPGNETNSALLLGDGQFLSLAQIKTWQNPFRGVELLTLSACNTATSGSGANGKEIEGFGVLAQQKGARAVIASLWPVADRSTMRLMQEFYTLRESGLSKAEAMRQAQSKMLRGELTMKAATGTREIVHETDKTAGLPKFKADAQRPYAHPYYWAPFILIGNWK